MMQIILLYSSLIIVSAFIINGWYAITRGRWETNPDGTKYWTGKIFNKFHYWLQRHTIEMKPYKNDEWAKIFFQLKGFFDPSKISIVSNNFMVVKPMDNATSAAFFGFALSKGIKVDVQPMKEGNGNLLIVAYKEVPKYKMHYMLRDPLGMCINCVASFYGSLLWIFWLYLARHINAIFPTNTGTAFIEIAWYWKICLWFLFCITLAHLNEFVLNLNKDLKDEKDKK